QSYIRGSIKAMRKRDRAVSSTEIPSPTEVILSTRPGDNRFGIAVDEEHLVSLAKPRIFVLHHAQRHTKHLPASLRLEENVIALPFQVDLRFSCFHASRCIGSCLPVLRVKVERIGRYFRHELIIDVGVERSHRSL